MAKAIYDKLAAALNARGMAVPAVPCAEYYALVEFLFSEDEAAIVCAMPIEYAGVEEIAANLGTKDLKKLAAQLEAMGDKGTIHIKEENGVKLYEGLPFVPGLIEFQLMKGIVDERHKKFAFLLRDYSKAVKREFMSVTPPKLQRSAAGRQIPVDKEIRQVTTVIPYKEVKELIQKTEYIAAGTCVCRHQGNLIGKPSSEPLNNCMVFGESAKFAVQRGFTKRLTREEALARLDEAEKAGLVHNYANTPQQFTNLLCNCCGCHCWIIKGAKNSPAPSLMVNARYLVHINEEDCTACEACIERCWMQALKMVDGKLTRDEKRCIGCGICMWACPTDALYLEPREAGKIPLKIC
ncbi:MAG: 4Fe-4S binding protein [Dehalococcoidia bacterium]|jgi:NAD-dependent dihydropyrimidine dehydrogenase PreA subunit